MKNSTLTILNPTRSKQLKSFFQIILNSTVAVFTLFMVSCSDDDDKKTSEEFPIFGTCNGVSAKGRMTEKIVDGKKTFHYTTNNGGTVDIDITNGIIFKSADYANFKYESWGNVTVGNGIQISANHENLNGKHIKDRIGTRRTIIFPDGAKVTYVAQGEQLPLISVSIYDGNEIHYINTACNTLEYSSPNSKFAQQLDDAEADGETATFEITATGLLFSSIYLENVAGNKIPAAYPLGEIFLDNPTQVNDYYDDPRLGHTRLSNSPVK